MAAAETAPTPIPNQDALSAVSSMAKQMSKTVVYNNRVYRARMQTLYASYEELYPVTNTEFATLYRKSVANDNPWFFIVILLHFSKKESVYDDIETLLTGAQKKTAEAEAGTATPAVSGPTIVPLAYNPYTTTQVPHQLITILNTLKVSDKLSRGAYTIGESMVALLPTAVYTAMQNSSGYAIGNAITSSAIATMGGQIASTVAVTALASVIAHSGAMLLHATMRMAWNKCVAVYRVARPIQHQLDMSKVQHASISSLSIAFLIYALADFVGKPRVNPATGKKSGINIEFIAFFSHTSITIELVDDKGHIDLSVVNALVFYLHKVDSLKTQVAIVSDVTNEPHVQALIFIELFKQYKITQHDQLLSHILKTYIGYVTSDIFNVYTDAVRRAVLANIQHLLDQHIIPPLQTMYDYVDAEGGTNQMINAVKLYIDKLGFTSHKQIITTFIARMRLHSLSAADELTANYPGVFDSEIQKTYYATLDMTAVMKAGDRSLLHTRTAAEVRKYLPYALLYDTDQNFFVQWFQECLQFAGVVQLQPIWDMAAGHVAITSVRQFVLAPTVLDTITIANMFIEDSKCEVSLLELLYNTVSLSTWLELCQHEELKQIFPFTTTGEWAKNMDIVMPMAMCQSNDIFTLVCPLLSPAILTSIICEFIRTGNVARLNAVLLIIQQIYQLDRTAIATAFLTRLKQPVAATDANVMTELFSVLYGSGALDVDSWYGLISADTKQQIVLLLWQLQDTIGTKFNSKPTDSLFSSFKQALGLVSTTSSPVGILDIARTNLATLRHNMTRTQLVQLSTEALNHTLTTINTNSPVGISEDIEFLSNLMEYNVPIVPIIFKMYTKYKPVYDKLCEYNKVFKYDVTSCSLCGGAVFDLVCYACAHTNATAHEQYPTPKPISSIDYAKLGVSKTTFNAIQRCVVMPTNVRFNDIIGLEEVKLQITNAVVVPLQSPQLFSGRSSSTGILLYGPPGTGKTMLAKAAAAASKCSFINISSALLCPAPPETGASIVKSLFVIVRAIAPCIMFFDEAESVFGEREDMKGERADTVTALLTQLDGVESDNTGIVVIAATNHPKLLDRATRRRVGQSFYVGLPSLNDRCDLFHRFYTQHYVEEADADDDIVQRLDFVGYKQYVAAHAGDITHVELTQDDSLYKTHLIISATEGLSGADIALGFDRILNLCLGSNSKRWYVDPISKHLKPLRPNQQQPNGASLITQDYATMCTTDKQRITNFDVRDADYIETFVNPDTRIMPTATQQDIDEYTDVKNSIWTKQPDQINVARLSIAARKRAASTTLIKWNRKRNHTVDQLGSLISIPAEFRAKVTSMIVSPATLAGAKVFGHADVLRELNNATSVIMHSPQLFEQTNLKPPFAVLLTGPPGTGKTEIARVVANTSNWTFFSVSPAKIIEKYVGSSASTLAALFDCARYLRPSVIFIDEIDALVAKRTAGGSDGSQNANQVINEFLVQLDGLYDNDGLLVIAATNRVDAIDPAALARFTQTIPIPLPDAKTRAEIIVFAITSYKLKYDDALVAEITKLHAFITAPQLGAIPQMVTMSDKLSGRDIVRIIKNTVVSCLGSNAVAWTDDGEPQRESDNPMTYESLTPEQKRSIKNFTLTLAQLTLAFAPPTPTPPTVPVTAPTAVYIVATPDDDPAPSVSNKRKKPSNSNNYNNGAAAQLPAGEAARIAIRNNANNDDSNA